MIEVVYRGRLGNRLFQYCFGRIVAESLGYRLACPPVPGFVGTGECVAGRCYSTPVVTYTADEVPDLNAVLADASPRKIIVNAYLQQYYYYKSAKHRIRRWLHIPPYSGDFEVTRDDLLLNMRLGDDYDNHERCWILHESFFYQVLLKERYRKLYICTDAPRHESLRLYEKYCPTVVAHDDFMDDFRFIKAFKKIAISTSTFSWWAAFLSDAHTIYYPDTRQSPSNVWGPSYPQVNLRVDDEARYVFLPARGLRD
jgi:hypothetical protein